MPMLFPLLIISLAGTVSRACRHYMSRHSQYARFGPPSSFFVTSAWLKNLQLVWKSSQALTARMCLAFSHFFLGAQTLFTCVPPALWPSSQSWLQNYRFTQCFVRIIRACETLFVPIPALLSILASYLQSRGRLWYLCQTQCAVSGAMSRFCGTLPTSSSLGSSSDLAACYISPSLFVGSVPPSCPVGLVEGLWHCQSSLSAHRASSEQDSPCSVLDLQCWLSAHMFKVFWCVNCRYI